MKPKVKVKARVGRRPPNYKTLAYYEDVLVGIYDQRHLLKNYELTDMVKQALLYGHALHDEDLDENQGD